MEEEDQPDIREQIFHSTVREYIIFLLLFIMLYALSFLIIRKFKRKDNQEYFHTDEDEATVYRISLWLCTFSFSVCLCATLLLPFSIASNEVLLHYPTSYYVKWLNHSLIQGLWNLVFLFSNVALFLLLPFAYLFLESEGFLGCRKGVMSRVHEALAVLSLLMLMVLGLTYVISALIDKKNANIQTFFNLGSYYLPFLYSCISFLGVLLLLLCTPIGFARLFSIVSSFLVKPQFLQDINQDFYVASLQENCFRRRLERATLSGKTYLSPEPMYTPPPTVENEDSELLKLQNGALQACLMDKIEEMAHNRQLLDRQRHTWVLQRNVVYPVCMLILLALTAITVLIVVQNTIELLIGIKALPISSRQFTLGLTSLSKLGPTGAVLEVVLILYLAVTSTVGLYSLPLLWRITPCLSQTPFYYIIANCALLLVLSSALPLLSRTLGITNFDLLGVYGQIEWLGNFKIILLYNLTFAVSATLCLFNKFSLAVRRELYNRLQNVFLIFCNVDPDQSTRAASAAKQD
uniref:Protein LMBR1L n=1 Tax=Homalodisca liturata TaxID=320908 RepID=A0A1B6K5F8_9HEMI